MYIAHINENDEIQTCKNHSVGTARISKDRLESVNLGNVAYLSGILHDAGKFTDDFKKYIIDSHNNVPVRKGSVIHTFAGCSYILKKYHTGSLDIHDVTAELIAYAIGAHHGLFDCIDDNGKCGFEHRLHHQSQYDDIAMANFFNECLSESDIDTYFHNSISETENMIHILFDEIYEDEEKENCVRLFYIGLLARLILSAVIDGDREDTYRFMSGQQFASIGTIKSLNWKLLINNIENYLSSKECNTPIQKARAELSDICAQFSMNEPDIYQIKLPTGAGKTLSGLRYALYHSEKYNKKRIIYVAPLISILEQNVKVIKEAVGDSSIVLEHHSNVVIEDDRKVGGQECEIDKDSYQLLTENWNSPIIVTTLVQFLNTLFGGKTSQVRRFASLVDSVIILDEVQTVPYKMISIFNLAINFLKKACHATILLCSATQPTFEQLDYKMLISSKSLLSKEQESYYMDMFSRSQIVFDGSFKLERIPEYIQNLIDTNNSILIICNKKGQSEYLFHAMKDMNIHIFHLSAAMCAAHREDVLKKMNYALLQRENKVICIATQVIEAGVDISFETVIRFEAGLDSIIQANGRCNRNGEMKGLAVTHIIRCSDEDLTKLEDIRLAKNASTELLEDYNQNKDLYQNNISSHNSVEAYYNYLFRLFDDKKTCYYIPKYEDYLINLLSDNGRWFEMYHSTNNKMPYFINQAFLSAGSVFEPLDTDTISVLVPYGEGAEIINGLGSGKAKYDIRFAKELINKAKKYSVSVMHYQAKNMIVQNAIYKIFNDSIYVLREDFYNSETGIVNGKEERTQCSTLIL